MNAIMYVLLAFSSTSLIVSSTDNSLGCIVGFILAKEKTVQMTKIAIFFTN